MKRAPFILEDPRPRQAGAPYTFFLPHLEQLKALDIGDFVKLIFIPTTDGTKYDVERMWVEISEMIGTEFHGKLANQLDDIPGLTIGDLVSFQAWHIIDIEFDDQKKISPLNLLRPTYYERCLVDCCVLTGDALIHYIYREEPDSHEEGDAYPDSGWRIRGDWRGLTDAQIDAREAEHAALGHVLNEDDSWLHLLDSPIGSGFIRDWEKDIFVQEVF